MAESLVLDRNGLVANLLERKEVERMWHEHQSGSRDHNVFLWGVMMLGLWEQGTRTPPGAASASTTR